MARWTFNEAHTAAEFCVRHMMITYVTRTISSLKRPSSRGMNLSRFDIAAGDLKSARNQVSTSASLSVVNRPGVRA